MVLQLEHLLSVPSLPAIVTAPLSSPCIVPCPAVLAVRLNCQLAMPAVLGRRGRPYLSQAQSATVLESLCPAQSAHKLTPECCRVQPHCGTALGRGLFLTPFMVPSLLPATILHPISKCPAPSEPLVCCAAERSCCSPHPF